MDLANDAEVTQNDFDALINFDDPGNTDFFADDSKLMRASKSFWVTSASFARSMSSVRLISEGIAKASRSLLWLA
jgi:hypothetical protein